MIFIYEFIQNASFGILIYTFYCRDEISPENQALYYISACCVYFGFTYLFYIVSYNSFFGGLYVTFFKTNIYKPTLWKIHIILKYFMWILNILLGHFLFIDFFLFIFSEYYRENCKSEETNQKSVYGDDNNSKKSLDS